MSADSASQQTSPEKPLAGRVAVVTGGASGIGRAAAIALAEAGATVVAGDFRLRPENNARFAALGIVQLECDVRDESQVEQLIAGAAEIGGRLDILVHSAGIILVRQIPDTTEAEWDACLDTNVKGGFLAAKHAIPVMRRSGGGSIVMISSNAGLLPRAHDPIYSTSKGALIAFTRSLALSHSPDRIRANAICPGPVSDTAIIDDDLATRANAEAAAKKIIAASPLCQAYGRMVTPEEIAASVLYLVSDAAVMVTGTAIAIDGGKSLGVPPVV